MFGGLDVAVMGISFIGGMLQKSMQNRHEQSMLMLNQAQKDVQRARNVNDDWFKWTRRVIALTAMSYIFVGPLLAIFLGEPIWVSYTEDNSWLASLISGDSDLMWKQLPSGFIIAPLHQYIAESIVFLYFGRK